MRIYSEGEAGEKVQDDGRMTDSGAVEGECVLCTVPWDLCITDRGFI